MRFNRLLVPLTVLSLGLAACSDDDDPVGPDPSSEVGSIEATYSGTVSGSLDATGALEIDPFTGEVTDQTYAAAFPLSEFSNATEGYLALGSDLDGQAIQSVLFLFNTNQTGVYQVDPFCDYTDTSVRCAFLTLEIDPDYVVDGDEAEFDIVDGTMTVESITAGRIRGSFSGIAHRYFAEAYDEGVEISISGTFDVPVLRLSNLGLASVAPARASLETTLERALR